MKKDIKELFEECPDGWTYEDLKIILEDLENGGDSTKETIKEIIKEVEENEATQCATCGQSINIAQIPFLLEFGPENIRKEAHFCAIDCLQYFIKNIKELKDRKKEFSNKISIS